MKKVRFLAPLAALAAVAVVAASVAGSGAAAPEATFRVGLVSDVARFNDQGFNQSQLEGAKRLAAKDKSIQISTAESRSASDYLPNLASFARRGYNLVIASGYLLAPAEATVAKQYPNVKFAVTDQSAVGPPIKSLKNVEGLTYATQENSWLAGCLAGLMTKKQGGKQIIGVVGGIKIPPVDTFLAGYKAGAEKCNPGIKVLIGYSQDFIDQAKCKTVAQNQIDAGSQVEFNVAGPCGLGTLDAANDAGIWGIGVDVDQYATHPGTILTSAVKRVDTGVYLAIKGVQTGKGFNGGRDLVFNLKNGGVGLGKINPNVPGSVLKTLNKYRAQIISGKIKPPLKIGG